MKYKYYHLYINEKTIGRNDITPIFEHAKVFANLITDLAKPFRKVKFNKIVGLDALGFVIGGAMANKLKKGFVVARKGGKLPGKNLVRISFVDYTKKKKVFEMNKGSITKRDKVLIVDEWIETGAQVKAAIRLVERQGGKVIGISTLAADKKPKTRILFEKYNLQSIREN